MLEQESDKSNRELERGIDKEKNPKILKVKKKGTWINSVGVGYGNGSQDSKPLDNHISAFSPNQTKLIKKKKNHNIYIYIHIHRYIYIYI